jgi:predicted GNAT family N-acyltransferase
MALAALKRIRLAGARRNLTMRRTRASGNAMDAPAALRVIEVGGDRARMEQAWALRRRVFIQEQHVPEEIELDADDARAVHALALEGAGPESPERAERPVGCGRMLAQGDYVKIGRMAVLAERRGTGVGRRVLEFLIEHARQRGFRRAVLDAQLHAEGFYLKQGFTPVGEVFEEAGIMHRRMERAL